MEIEFDKIRESGCEKEALEYIERYIAEVFGHLICIMFDELGDIATESVNDVVDCWCEGLQEVLDEAHELEEVMVEFSEEFSAVGEALINLQTTVVDMCDRLTSEVRHFNPPHEDCMREVESESIIKVL